MLTADVLNILENRLIHSMMKSASLRKRPRLCSISPLNGSLGTRVKDENLPRETYQTYYTALHYVLSTVWLNKICEIGNIQAARCIWYMGIY